MPGYVGAIQIIGISSAGVFNVGDVLQIRPVSTSKVFSGAGSFNTGYHINVQNHLSSTNTLDPDAVDSSIQFTL